MCLILMRKRYKRAVCKCRKNISIICLAFFVITVYAQRADRQQIFVATSEKEMHQLFNQMLDSARVSNVFLSPCLFRVDWFGFALMREIESRDTLMKFAQCCLESSREGFICDRFYWGYISNSMSIDFYGRFLDYLRKLNTTESYFVKSRVNFPLFLVIRIIKRQYESGELNEQDSVQARQLIEETLLRMINDDHNYRMLVEFHEYVTDSVRQALINVLENPFFPAEYLEFFMSRQDTLHLDTISIPQHLRQRVFYDMRGEFTAEELVYIDKMNVFWSLDRTGREIFGGLSAGETYLKGRKRFFEALGQTGFLPVNHIARYAYKKRDELLIKHLKKFRERFPDFPLEHF